MSTAKVVQVKTVIFSLQFHLNAVHWWNGGRLHCPVHVVRQTADGRSLSICYHDPSFELDPLKPLINGLFLVQGGDLGNKGSAARATLCRNPSGSLRTTWPFLLAKQN